MYISVFFGLIPTIKEEIIQIQCIVSLSLSIIAEFYVRMYVTMSRFKCGCMVLGIF